MYFGLTSTSQWVVALTTVRKGTRGMHLVTSHLSFSRPKYWIIFTITTTGRYSDHSLWSLPWSSLGCSCTPSSQGPSTASTSRAQPQTVMKTTVREVGRDLYLILPNLNSSKPSYWKCFTNCTTIREKDHDPSSKKRRKEATQPLQESNEFSSVPKDFSVKFVTRVARTLDNCCDLDPYPIMQAQYFSSTDTYSALHLFVMYVQVLNIQITCRSVPHLYSTVLVEYSQQKSGGGNRSQFQQKSSAPAPSSASAPSPDFQQDQKGRASGSMSQGSTSGNKTYPTCPKCGKNHPGECLAGNKRCFGCGQYGHRLRDCPSK
uniref:Retrotransposon gag protein n=1 Tax=Solanum tuberosum TaxID=4113 RepID=M1DTY8_SOLTU